MSRAPFAENEPGCRRWNLPEFGGSATLPGGSSQDATDESQTPAHEEGFEQGRREGYAAGRQEVTAQAQRFDKLMRGLTQPFEELDREVEEGLVALTFAIVRQLVRAEIKTSPEQVVSIVNETVELLPAASRDIQLYLHPEDAQLLQQISPVMEGEGKWQIKEDTSLQRGGCVVKTRASRIDATVETRLENIIASFLHVENSKDETA